MNKVNNKTRPCVLVTRPMGQANKIVREIEALGANAIVSPVIDIQPVPFQIPSLNDYDALIFTSVNALRLFAQKTKERGCKIYCVGQNTAQFAVDNGFLCVDAAENDANSLFFLIKEHNLRNVLYFSAEDTAFPMAERLADVGVNCDQIVVYNAQPCFAFNADTIDALRAHTIDYVLLYSRRSAEYFISLIKDVKLEERLKSIKALCLSDGVVQSIEPELWQDYTVSTVSNGEGMMALLAAEIADWNDAE